jgi:hypothetical protein
MGVAAVYGNAVSRTSETVAGGGALANGADIEAELKRIDHPLRPPEIVVINTAAGARYGQPDYVPSGCGVDDHAEQPLLRHAFAHRSEAESRFPSQSPMTMRAALSAPEWPLANSAANGMGIMPSRSTAASPAQDAPQPGDAAPRPKPAFRPSERPMRARERQG